MTCSPDLLKYAHHLTQQQQHQQQPTSSDNFHQISTVPLQSLIRDFQPSSANAADSQDYHLALTSHENDGGVGVGQPIPEIIFLLPQQSRERSYTDK